MRYLTSGRRKTPSYLLTLLLFLAPLSTAGCNNAFYEVDTKVRLVEGSAPPTFEITGNGKSATFLIYGPFEGDYGKNGDPPPLWQLDPKPEAGDIEVNKYSPFTYGQIPADYIQNKPKNNQIPELLEGKEYNLYIHVNGANGGGVCFRIQNQKAVRCQT
jgi:hypothetical protein